MQVSSLTIKDYDFAYRIPEKNFEGTYREAEFLIDDEPLAQHFKIWGNRPWFGRTGFDNDTDAIKRFARELLAELEPSNELESKRLVLYRCHCGSDYCGVISCQIIKENELIHWLDIREEVDEGDAEILTSVKIEKISFDFKQYRESITAFLQNRG